MDGNGHSRARRDRYWVCAVENESQRPIVDGPHDTESEAQQWGFAHIRDGNFKVYAFPTTDKFRARDMFRHIRLEETGRLSDMFKRAKYKV